MSYIEQKREKTINTVYLFAVAVVTVVLVVLRTIIANNHIEEVTGFYTGGKGIITVFNILLALFTVAVIVYPLVKFRQKRLDASPSGKGMGIMSFVIAAGFVYDIYTSMTIFTTSKACTHFIHLFSSNRAETTNIAVELFQGYALLIGAIFALFSVIYFMVMGLHCLNNTAGYMKRGVLALAPLWWGVFKAVYLMLIPMNFAKMSDLLYEVLMIGFLILFFSTFARIASRINGEHSVGKALAYGTCAAVFAAISSLPRIFASLMGTKGVVYTSPQDASEIVFKSEYCMMALAAFIFCAVFVAVSYVKIAKGKAYLEGEQQERNHTEMIEEQELEDYIERELENQNWEDEE
ncbi:MAG: hypothetical protein IKU25_02890 [Clostridia bacterium]|nr:hypothetical protein [Clostridia bacterium]